MKSVNYYKLMKKLILFAAILLSGMAQAETYREALKTLISSSSFTDMKTIQEGLQESFNRVYKSMDGADKSDSVQVFQMLQAYVNTQMTDDMADLLQPYFSKYVTEDDLQTLILLQDDARYAELTAKTRALKDNLENSAEFKKFQLHLVKAAISLVSDEEPDDVAIPKTIPKSYQKTFVKYYKTSGTEEMINGSYSAISGLMQAKLQAQGISKQEADEFSGKFSDYMFGNMRTILMCLFHSSVTEDDLNYLLRVTDTDAMRHYSKAMAAMTKDMQSFGMQLVLRMAKWVVEQMPQEEG